MRHKNFYFSTCWIGIGGIGIGGIGIGGIGGYWWFANVAYLPELRAPAPTPLGSVLFAAEKILFPTCWIGIGIGIGGIGIIGGIGGIGGTGGHLA